MQYSKFAIDEDAWCVWDWNLHEQNLDFIKSVNPAHFEYLGQIYAKSEDKQDQSAALALRTAYSHGLETFFAFLFAAIQAPDCVIGWVHKYDVSQIRSLLQKVKNRQPIFSKVGIHPFTWRNISNTVLSFKLEDKDKEARIKQNFAMAWGRFADEFLQPTFAYEYNSIKHGLRAKSGGFWVAFGKEDVPGKRASPERMRLLGKTDYGSTFYTVEAFDIKAKDNTKRHFRLLRHSQSWNIEKYFLGLHLISLSLQNVLAFLKIVNGCDPVSVEFAWPDNEEHFQEPKNPRLGVSGISMNNIIPVETIIPFSKEEILSVYNDDYETNENKNSNNG